MAEEAKIDEDILQVLRDMANRLRLHAIRTLCASGFRYGAPVEAPVAARPALRRRPGRALSGAVGAGCASSLSGPISGPRGLAATRTLAAAAGHALRHRASPARGRPTGAARGLRPLLLAERSRDAGRRAGRLRPPG